MKLKHELKSEINILHINGSVSEKHFKILKAGIEKFLREGKNRIILSLEGGGSLESEAVRLIADFNTLAKELSGEILLVIPDEKNKKIIESFSKPPLVVCHISLESALKHFEEQDQDDKKSSQSDETEKVSVTPTKDISGDVLETIENQKQEIANLKKQLADSSKGEQKDLKQRNVVLEQANQELEKEVEKLLSQRRIPPKHQIYDEKVKQMEQRLNQLVQKIQTLEKQAADQASS